MLQKLNECFQGVVAWVIIGLVTVTFTLFGIEYYVQSRQTASNVVLEVNGSPITKEMVSLKLERAHRILDEKSEFNEKSYRKKIIDELVNSQIGLQSARQSGFYVSESQAAQTIFKLPEFSEKGHFSPTRYQQILSATLYTHDEFEHELQQDMLIQQQRFAFLATDFTLPNEFLAYVKETYQSRRYRYVQIPADLFLNEQHVTSKEREAYYQQHQQAFTSPEAVSLAYIRLSMTDIKAKLTLTSGELQQYYRENQASFIENGKAKAFSQVKKEIQAQLIMEKAQLEYARLLETLSDVSYQTPDELETTAKTLGLKVQETEVFTREGGHSLLTQNPQIVHLAFSDALLVSGDNSNPFQLDPETVVVFRVLAHEPVKQLPFEMVTARIENILINEKSIQAAAHVGELLLHANEDERSHLMAKYRLSWRNRPLTTREALNEMSAIHQLAFSVEKSGEFKGAFVPVIEDKKAYVLLQLEEIADGTLQKLTPEKQATLMQRLSLQQGLVAYDAYVASQKNAASIARMS